MEILISLKRFIMGNCFLQFSSSSSSSSFSFSSSGVCRYYGRTRFILLLNVLFLHLFFYLFSSFFSFNISFSKLLGVDAAAMAASSSKHHWISRHQNHSPSVAQIGGTESTSENIEVKQESLEVLPPPRSSKKDGKSEFPNNDTMVIDPDDVLNRMVEPLPADVPPPPTPAGAPAPSHLQLPSPVESVLLKPERNLSRAAYHEAGHAVAAYYLRRNVEDVKGVNIVSSGNTDGYMEQVKPEGYPTIENLRSRLPIFFAGSEAEKLKFHENRGDLMDYRMAENVASQVSIFEEQKKYIKLNTRSIPEELLVARRQLELREAQKKAKDILKQHQDALERVSQRLLEKRQISGLELQRLIEDESSRRKSKETIPPEKSSKK